MIGQSVGRNNDQVVVSVVDDPYFPPTESLGIFELRLPVAEHARFGSRLIAFAGTGIVAEWQGNLLQVSGNAGDLDALVALWPELEPYLLAG